MSETKKKTPQITVTLTGKEYNAVVMAIAAIGGRAFGAESRAGVDPIEVMTNAAVAALHQIGGEGVGALIQRLGDAMEAAAGPAALTTNLRETSVAAVVPLAPGPVH